MCGVGVVDRAYLICATERTGSTVLCDLLSLAGTAGDPQEYFHPEKRDSFRAAWEAFNHRPYFAMVVRATAAADVFGVKVHSTHRPCVEQDLAEVLGRPSVDMHAGLIEYFGDVRYVHLRREDTLRQAVSFYRAAATKRWNTLDHQAHPEPEYSADAIFEAHRRLTDGDRAWDEYFAERGIQPLKMSYEGLIADTPAEIDRVLRFLGLPPSPVAHLEASRFRKQADDRTDEWVERARRDFGSDLRQEGVA